MCANFQSRWTTLNFSAQICPKMDLGFEIQKTNVGVRISILTIPCVPIFRQNGQPWLFWPSLPKNEFWGQNFKNLSPGSQSAPQRYHECQFSFKMDNFRFFGLNLGKFPISCGILVLIRLRELVGGWNELDGGEWSWVEVDEAGWRWVHGSVIPHSF